MILTLSIDCGALEFSPIPGAANFKPAIHGHDVQITCRTSHTSRCQMNYYKWQISPLFSTRNNIHHPVAHILFRVHGTIQHKVPKVLTYSDLSQTRDMRFGHWLKADVPASQYNTLYFHHFNHSFSGLSCEGR